MCVALPARVLEIGPGPTAEVELNGRPQRVSIQAVAHVAPGDYVLVNLGMAVERLSPEEAAELLSFWEQMSSLSPSPGEVSP